MKLCTSCKINKQLKDFSKNKSTKDEYNYHCKLCFKLYYNKNKNRIKKSATKSQIKNKDYRQKYLKKYSKVWRLKFKEKNCYKAALYRCRKIKATPKWVDLEAIKEIYKNCPKGYHVDHIHPLKGKNSCGLHVPWNLQYLPAIENIKKSNKGGSYR